MLTNVKAGEIRCIEILCIENKAGVWEQTRSRRCDEFTVFSKKKYAFLGILWSKFRVFKWLNKVLMRPQGLCPGAHAPTCPLLLCHWAHKQRQYICYRYSAIAF